MKKICLFTVLIFLIFYFPKTIFGNQIYIGSRGFSVLQDVSNTANQQQLFAPVYEYLSMDSSDTGIKGLTINFYGWGRLIAGQSYTYETNDGGIEYANIHYTNQHYTNQHNTFGLVMGRQLLFGGVTQANMDGIKVSSNLPLGFMMDIFAGKPVRYGLPPGSHDFTYGGKLGYQLPWRADVALSYMQLTQNNIKTQNNIGLNAYTVPVESFQIAGRLFYSTIFKEIYEGNLTMNVLPITRLKLSLFAETDDPKTLMGQGSVIGSLFAVKYNDYGTSIEYDFPFNLRIEGDSGIYYYFNGTRAVKYGVNIRETWQWQGTNIIGASYSQLLSPVSFAGDYWLLRGYLKKHINNFLFTIDYIHSLYREYIYNYNGADNLTGSIGYTIAKNLDVSGAIFYSIDPRYENQTNAGLYINYSFMSSNSKRAEL